MVEIHIPQIAIIKLMNMLKKWWSESESPKKNFVKVKPKKMNWVGTLWKCVVECRQGVSYCGDAGNEFYENRNLISKN